MQIQIPVQTSKFESFNQKAESFKSYLKRFENHLEFINLQDETRQAQLLRESIGAEPYNNLSAFLGPENPPAKLSYSELKSKFMMLLQVKKSSVLAQHQFLQIYQSENQTLAEYVAEL